MEDIQVGEDIKILEEFILWIKREGIEDSYEKEILAIEHLIKKYKKKDKIIEEMAKRIKNDTEWFYSELDNYTAEEIIEYFTKEVEREVEQ